MEIHGNPWKSMEIHGIPWKSMEFHETPMEYPWSSMEIHGNPSCSLLEDAKRIWTKVILAGLYGFIYVHVCSCIACWAIIFGLVVGPSDSHGITRSR